jgi:hypothetical protein
VYALALQSARPARLLLNVLEHSAMVAAVEVRGDARLEPVKVNAVDIGG